MNEKTPDQIRRETIPVKHAVLIYGFFGGLIGATVWFGGFTLLHWEQVRRYPEYVGHAIKMNTAELSLFGRATTPTTGLTAEQLRYAMLRYGNVNHRFDAEIIIHGWYPKGASSPESWVHHFGDIQQVYTEDAAMVFKWPLALTVLTFTVALVWGMVEDYRYRSSIIAGLQFDGSIVATVAEYNAGVKGDGMKYRVKAWEDR